MQRPSLLTLPVVVLSLAAGILSGAEQASAETNWTIGQCYQLTAAQQMAETLPAEAAPVDCTAPHNAEVAWTGPAGANPAASAARACSVPRLYAATGIPLGRMISSTTGPLPWLASLWWTSADKSTLTCAAVVGYYPKKGRGAAKTISTPISDLAPGGPAFGTAGLCVSRPKPAQARSIPCALTGGTGTVPWVVWRIINNAADGAGYPGEKALIAASRRLCQFADQDWYAIWPTKDDWGIGRQVTYCYRVSGI